MKPTPPLQAAFPTITLTGADERTDVGLLAGLDAEIGLLYTATPEGRNRYPRWEWISAAAAELPRASLHVCGRGARELLMAGVLDVGSFQRLQVNGALEPENVEALCCLYPEHTIITQHHPRNRALLAVEADNHAVLIDGSGGRGISPDGWEPPVTGKACGFAGGLGPDNLASEGAAICAVARPGWWADMEGKLRVDDWFSTELAAECVTVFRRLLIDTLPEENSLRSKRFPRL